MADRKSRPPRVYSTHDGTFSWMVAARNKKEAAGLLHATLGYMTEHAGQKSNTLALREPGVVWKKRLHGTGWERMTPREGGESLDGVHRPTHFSGAPFYGVLHLDRAIQVYNIDLDVDFQRDYVWTESQQRIFMGHILEGGFVSRLILNTGPEGSWPHAQLVDGKQRVTACLRWAAGEIPAELSDERLLWAAHLDKVSCTKCAVSIGLEFGLVRLTRAEALDLYIRINRGGTIHTEHEIRRVRDLLEEERRRGVTQDGQRR